MNKKIELCCEPKPETVWRLLGMRGKADQQMQKVLESELAALGDLVKPVALVRHIRADEALVKPTCRVRGDGALDGPAHRGSGAGRSITHPLAVGEELLAVLLTVGRADAYVKELFSEGEHLRALIADGLLSAWLFAMDEALQEVVGDWCRRHGFGVGGRLEAPGELPAELQRVICGRLESETRAGVCVNDGCMLVPEKSMCYLLRLNRDCGRFAMGHDCSRCNSKDCGMRL